MAPEKKKKRREKSSAAARAAEHLSPSPDLKNISPLDAIRKDLAESVPFDKLTDEEQRLLVRARGILDSLGKRMTAITRAAAEKWVPAQSALEVNETSGPVLGDDEFTDIVDITEILAEATMIRSLGLYLEVPEPILDEVIVQRLLSQTTPSAKATSHVAHRRAGKGHEDK